MEIEDGTAGTIGCSSMRCSGSLAPAHHGGICRKSSATGIACSSVSADGPRKAFGSVFSIALVENPDFEYLIIDSTIVRAHQHAAGAKGGAKMRRSGVRAVA